MRKKISLFLIVAIMLSLFVLPDTSLQALAAARNVELAVVSTPGEIDALKNIDKGILFESVLDEAIYSFTIQERGWVVIDTENKSFIQRPVPMYRNPSLTIPVDEINSTNIDGQIIRWIYYLDPGVYYLYDYGLSSQGYSTFSGTIYGFFLPNSSSITHSLKKSKDGTHYTDRVKFSANLGTTRLVNSKVDAGDINASQFWDEAETNAEDSYKITKNGEYTIKANFTDAEWKDYPAMYSFSVYDITKPPKAPKAPAPKVATSGKKAIKVTWNKISGIKKYELQYSTTKNFKKPVTKTYKSTQKSAKISKLKSKKKYYVRMRSYKVFGGKKIYSKWSKVKTITTK